MRFIRSKFNLLIVLTGILFSLGIALVIVHNFYTFNKIKTAYIEKQSSAIRNAFEMQSRVAGKYLKNAAADPAYFPCNIITNPLQSPDFKPEFDYIAITDSAMFPLAVFPAEKTNFISLLPGSTTHMNKILSDGMITRIFGWDKDTLLRISCIKIPWCDDGKFIAYGWLFTGEVIDLKEQDFMSAMINGTIQVHKEPFDPNSTVRKHNPREGFIYNTIPLYGSNNIPIASVELETPSAPMADIEKYQHSLILMLIILSVLFIAFIFVYLRHFYILPLKRITLAFKFKDPEMLRLSNTNDKDFSPLQEFMMNVFSQEQLLNEMISHRSDNQTNSFYAAILYQITDAVYATDHNNTITFWNNAAEDLYRIKEKDALTQKADTIIATQWKDNNEKDFQEKQFAHTGLMHGKLIHTTPNGTEFTVEVVIKQLTDCTGKLIGYMHMVRKTA
jgi:PAS domain S-box-containing protein